MKTLEELQYSPIFSQIATQRSAMSSVQREQNKGENVRPFRYPFSLERKLTSIISKEIYSNHIKPFKKFVKENYNFWKDSYVLRKDTIEDLDYVSLAIDTYFKDSPEVFSDASDIWELLEEVDMYDSLEWKAILKSSINVDIVAEPNLDVEILSKETERVTEGSRGIITLFKALVTVTIVEAIVKGKILKKVVSEVHDASNRARGRTDSEGNYRRQTEEEFISRNVTSDVHSQVSKDKMKESLIEIYKWATAGDERVRGNPSGTNPTAKFSHYLMDNLYKQIDNPNMVSEDGKKWRRVRGREEPRHAGSAANCRCVMIASFIRIIEAVDKYVA